MRLQWQSDAALEDCCLCKQQTAVQFTRFRNRDNICMSVLCYCLQQWTLHAFVQTVFHCAFSGKNRDLTDYWVENLVMLPNSVSGSRSNRLTQLTGRQSKSLHTVTSDFIWSWAKLHNIKVLMENKCSKFAFPSPWCQFSSRAL